MAAAPLIGLAAGGALGAVKNNQKKAEYNRQKQLAADTAVYSPWTGLNAMSMMPKEKPSLFGDVLGGAVGGAMTGANIGGGWGFGGGNTNPMQGAQQVGGGGADSGLSAFGQQGLQGMNQFAGGYENAPNLYNQSRWASIS